MSKVDENFYNRADEHINLSNDQINEVETSGKVSASMMYASARFSAWLSATGCESKLDMIARREDNTTFFTEQFRAMLEENYDDYIGNFESYMLRIN